MGTIKTFKELDTWKKAVELTREIYHISGKGDFRKDFSLQNQIRRAAVSIPSNIAEGFEREGNKEFIQFLTVAKGSAAEVQTQLRIAYEVSYITDDDFKKMDDICIEVLSLISGFLRYLRSSGIKGNKFKRS
ncbi:MAG TPA: four helix bundle protein [Proteobacteria bacterium]|nr:four helix bundle protein [Pseudomonadota bacterium]